MEKIAVNLYGGKGIFSGKETPLRAEEIYCDKHEKCSLFKNNCCLNVTAPFSYRCKFGTLKSIQGYTSRAKKYGQFKEKYKSDEKYSNLKYPSNCKIALIDDYIYLNVLYAKVKYEDNSYYVDTVGFGSANSWIELDKFDCDLLYSICKYKTYAMTGGEISAYKRECIPDMLEQLRRVLPKLYDNFIKVYPEFNVKPDYTGKHAYIKTIVKGSILSDCHGNKFKFDGEYLVCETWKLSFVPFDAGVAELKIKVTDEMKYKIDNNAQVDKNTIFVQ